MNSRLLHSTVLLLLVSAGCSRDANAGKPVAASAPTKPKAISIRVAAVETRGVTKVVDVTGALAPDDTINIVSEVAGRIANIRFDFGQTVRKGDTIAEIDRQEFQIQVDRARAALAQALARVGLNADQESENPTTTPLIRQARAQLEDAKSKHESAKKLFESGDVARERFIETEKLLNSRQASLDSAMDDLRTSMASVQALRADKRLYEKRLSDTVIRAPFDGQISQRMAAPGQYVKDNVPIVTLVKTWPLRLRADIPEVGVGAVRVGESLSFTTESIPGRTFTATVTQLNPSLESRSRSLSAEARLNQADPQLRPGMFVAVKLVVSRNAPITMVPKAAIYTVSGLSKLFTINGSVAREIRFTPGQSVEDWLEVPEGLVHAGESVAVDNLNLLTDGSEVRIDATPPRPPAAAGAKGD